MIYEDILFNQYSKLISSILQDILIMFIYEFTTNYLINHLVYVLIMLGNNINVRLLFYLLQNVKNILLFFMIKILTTTDIILNYIVVNYSSVSPSDPFFFGIILIYIVNTLILSIISKIIYEKIDDVTLPGSKINYKNENIECSICLNNKCNWSLPCNHKFHLECLKKWHSTINNNSYHKFCNFSCPLCRRKHKPVFINPQY